MGFQCKLLVSDRSMVTVVSFVALAWRICGLRWIFTNFVNCSAARLCLLKLFLGLTVTMMGLSVLLMVSLLVVLGLSRQCWVLDLVAVVVKIGSLIGGLIVGSSVWLYRL